MKKFFSPSVAVGLAAISILILLSSPSVGQSSSETTKSLPGISQPGTQRSAVVPAAVSLCASCIKAHMEFLASDAMRGRGSGTADELLAATYVGSQMRAYGIAPAGDDGGYIQRATLIQPKLTGPPTLTFAKPGSADPASAKTGEKTTWTYGKEFIARRLSQVQFSGPLRVSKSDAAATDSQTTGSQNSDSQFVGSIVLLAGDGGDRKKVRARISTLATAGAIAVIEVVSAEEVGHFQEKSAKLPSLPAQIEGQNASGLEGNFSLLEVSPEAGTILEALPAETVLSFEAPSTSEKQYTWNAVGMLRGRDPILRNSAVLLSAHFDHLGIGRAVKGDDIYNGADDDASGTTAVLELARVLGAGLRPRRTVIFALFGSEETGGLGSTYFREHPPIPLQQIAVNLEFEMLGRADPAVRSDTVWLTGWERSNLGPTLATRGANLVGDPHPEQNFFARSDNYVLAKKGVVAQTVSSYGLHADYHQPSDDLAHIDFKHMDAAIGSLLRPVSWLVNSSFTPKWNEGGKP
jgi:aminopeptidase YwaD